MRRSQTLALVIAALTLAVYAQALGFSFVSFDDEHYVTRNAHVMVGVTGPGLAWALTGGHENWHPLTWLSHMLDVEFYGMDPAGHHATSVVLHVINAWLLFAVLHTLTGAPLRSAGVAALFALHPLHVESVAWVSERKDVLSTGFGLLCLGAYTTWVRRGGAARYAAMLACFGLALMAKSMLVTLPFVFLLLDFWPLGRLRLDVPGWLTSAGHGRLWTEKLPLFALSAGACVATFAAQKGYGAMGLADALPLWDRVANAGVSYAIYLQKTLWPVSLAVHYPHPYVEGSGAAPYAVWQVALSFALLAALSLAALRSRASTVGWLWFLGTLVPVIGLVQVGTQALADRYTYLPLVGVFIAVVWPLSDALERWSSGREGLARAARVGGVAVLLMCAAVSSWQLRHWRSSETLFERALSLYPDDPKIHVNYGFALQSQDRLDEAIAHYQRALATRSDYALAHANLGSVLVRQGDLDAAIARFRLAIEADPGFSGAHSNLGGALRARGELLEATQHYERALALQPLDANHHLDLAAVWEERGEPALAMNHYQRALELRPASARAHCELAATLRRQGRFEPAIGAYRECVERAPGRADAWNNLGGLLRASGRGDEAIEAYRRALEVDPGEAQAHFNLANALASQGHLDDAIEHFRSALEIQPDAPQTQNNLTLALRLQQESH